jgi:integrase/recombinase XerD
MCEKVIAEFVDRLYAAGRATRTVQARRQAVGLLGRHAGVDPCQVSTGQIAAWLSSVPAAWSKHTYYLHARSWCAHLVLSGTRVDDPAVALARPGPGARFPRPADTASLLRAVDAAPPLAQSMLLLASYAGLRVSEIAAVRGQDIAENVYVLGKGGQQAMVPAHPLIAECATRMPARGWWYPSPRDPTRHVRRETAWKWMSDALAAADCAASPHRCRHFFGSQALAACGNLETTRQLLRHRSIASTIGYTLIPDTARQAVIGALPTLQSAPTEQRSLP